MQENFNFDDAIKPFLKKGKDKKIYILDIYMDDLNEEGNVIRRNSNNILYQPSIEELESEYLYYILKFSNVVSRKGWCNMDRQQTYNHLKSHNSGAYLIRPASRKGFIVISCRVNNEVKHALLNTNSPDFNEICNPNITTVEMQDLIAKQFNIENTFPSITENKMSPLLLSFQSENAKEIVYQYSKLIDASEMNVEDDQKGSSNALRIYV